MTPTHPRSLEALTRGRQKRQKKARIRQEYLRELLALGATREEASFETGYSQSTITNIIGLRGWTEFMPPHHWRQRSEAELAETARQVEAEAERYVALMLPHILREAVPGLVAIVPPVKP